MKILRRLAIIFFVLTLLLAFSPVAFVTAQTDPVEQCAQGVQLYRDGKEDEALPLLEAGFAGRDGATFTDLNELGRCASFLGNIRGDIGDVLVEDFSHG